MGQTSEEDHKLEIKYEIVVRLEAANEVQAAFDWYEEQNDGLGFEFLRAADAALQAIKRNPLAYQIVYEEVRRVLLRKFPYALFYITEQNKIIVLACFNQKRNPIDWLRRT